MTTVDIFMCSKDKKNSVLMNHLKINCHNICIDFFQIYIEYNIFCDNTTPVCLNKTRLGSLNKNYNFKCKINHFLLTPYKKLLFCEVFFS